MDPGPTMESLNTFIGITGASEAVAIRLLQENGGDLNAAVNAFFNEGDVPVGIREEPEPGRADYMEEDEPPAPVPVESRGLGLPLWGSGFNPLGIFQRANSPPAAPIISHPRETRSIPIQWEDDVRPAGPPNLSIHEVTDVDDVPSTHPGIVSIDDDLPPFPVAPGYPREREPRVAEVPSVPVVDYDVEEEMLQAALEESRRSASGGRINEEDDDIARAVSLSLKTAEDEKRWRDLTYDDTDVPLASDSNRANPVSTSTVVPVVPVEEPEEEPLLRRRSRRVVPVVEEPVEPRPVAAGDHVANTPQANGDVLHADEWGGISSEEHDEAVMLEAMFGGGLARMPYPLQQNFDPLLAPRPAPQPLSPSVVAQRLLREQQDDEYLASLAADREKELKAQQEAEAASQKEKQRLEEEQRKHQAEAELEKQLAVKAGSLPPEPSQEDADAVTIMVRLPDGSRYGRRFRKSDKLEHLFDFLDLSRAVKPRTYRLLRQYPRRAFTYDERSASFDSLGLTSRQEALFLETI